MIGLPVATRQTPCAAAVTQLGRVRRPASSETRGTPRLTRYFEASGAPIKSVLRASRCHLVSPGLREAVRAPTCSAVSYTAALRMSRTCHQTRCPSASRCRIVLVHRYPGHGHENVMINVVVDWRLPQRDAIESNVSLVPPSVVLKDVVPLCCNGK